MIWADRVPVGLLVLALPIILLNTDKGHALLVSLVLAFVVWLPLRALDFIATGKIRRTT